MKTKFTLLLLALCIGFSVSYAQQDEECMNNLSIFDSYAKNKNYDAAYEPWLIVRKKCPAYSRAIYVRGEKILEHKIKTSTGVDKVAYEVDLLKLYEEYNKNYGSKFKTGKMYSKKGNLSYKYREELKLTDEELYDIFHKGYTQDLENFTDPRALYTYFSLEVNKYKKGPKTTNDTQKLFDKYDEIKEIMELQENKNSKTLNSILQKVEAGTALTKKEKSQKKFSEGTLKVLGIFMESTDGLVEQFATCEILVPLYKEKFEENKNDSEWLQRAMNKMGQKDCTDDPLFEQLVAQKNTVQPDANTAYYLGLLNEKKGKTAEADKYYRQAEQLETDPLKKWKFVFGRAEKAKKQGSYGKARQLYRQALKLNPSKGTPHLRIAAMYAASANNCGTNALEKRAVYWLAAQEAQKAGNIDGRLKKAASQTVANYKAKAPDKSMLFSAGLNSGDSIKLSCWAASSVRVP